MEFTAIRRVCEALELGCPLHWDDDVAKAHGYPGLVMPSSSMMSRPPMWKPGAPILWPDREVHGLAHLPPARADRRLPSPRTTAGFQTKVETEYWQPVCVGDRLYRRGSKLVSVVVRDTRVGSGAFIVTES